MRRKAFSLVSLAAPALIGALAASCDKAGADPLGDTAEKLCGPCGAIATGDVGISGSAKLDGFFSAVGKISEASVSINGDFNANINALSQLYAVADFKADAKIDAKVDALVAAIKADFTANLDGGVSLNVKPAECHASVNVAVQAQAQCEVKGGCEAEVNPGSVEVKCEGECSGSCEGSCEGAVPTCEVSASATCEGKCEGSCTVEGGVVCEGTCHGECDGECSVKDGSGNCNGTCEGTCNGGCEANVAAKCEGTCSGKCQVEADAKCSGGEAPHCEGKCTGKCNASCSGKVEPPSAKGSCDASADCQAQASAQANASIECTPPSIDLSYSFKAGLEASAQAAFLARLDGLKVRGSAILQGFAKYDMLINGKKSASGMVVVKSPLVELKASVEGLADGAGEIFADVPVFRLNCALAGFGEAATALGKVATQATGNLAAQAKFATAFTGGFKS